MGKTAESLFLRFVSNVTILSRNLLIPGAWSSFTFGRTKKRRPGVGGKTAAKYRLSRCGMTNVNTSLFKRYGVFSQSRQETDSGPLSTETGRKQARNCFLAKKQTSCSIFLYKNALKVQDSCNPTVAGQ